MLLARSVKNGIGEAFCQLFVTGKEEGLMFLKKKESRGWHTCLVLVVGGLAVVGAIGLTHHAKGVIMKLKDKMSAMLGRCESDGCGE